MLFILTLNIDLSYQLHFVYKVEYLTILNTIIIFFLIKNCYEFFIAHKEMVIIVMVK